MKDGRSRRGPIAGLLGTLGLATAVGACALVTGSTDGYDLAAQDAGSTVDSGCSLVLDGGVCVVNVCASAADCPTTSAGPPICCEGFLGLAAIGTECTVGACALGSFQVCSSSAECGGQACLEQVCSLPPDAISVRACGAIPGCTLVGGGGGDGGGAGDGGDHHDGGSVVDAGSGTDASDAGSAGDAGDAGDGG